MINTHYRSFTLIDLIMALVVMVIIAAIAAPRYYNSLSRYRVEAAARRVAADFALTQRMARNTSASKTILFDSANNRYQISTLTDLDNSGDPYIVNLQDPPYQAELGLIDLGGDWKVIFDGFGIPDSGGFVDVQLGDVRYKVILNAETGATSIE
ncbi:MAG: prepilin-type N-terminal cleavage/methylation domain-containing protein [Planctomycetes bacterium]|nr:prepilin-type N-terminal cleavage/methylation domain-containing protein [Planctomycetota bacterium]